MRYEFGSTAAGSSGEFIFLGREPQQIYDRNNVCLSQQIATYLLLSGEYPGSQPQLAEHSFKLCRTGRWAAVQTSKILLTYSADLYLLKTVAKYLN